MKHMGKNKGRRMKGEREGEGRRGGTKEQIVKHLQKDYKKGTRDKKNVISPPNKEINLG